MNTLDSNHDDDRLRWQLRALRQDTAPARDLWPAIVARIAEPVPAALPAPPRRRYALSLALAASLLLAAGLAWQVPPPAPAASQAAPDALARREAQAMARQYRGALDELAPLPQAPRGAAYASALRELDASADAILRALERDPDSRLLLEQLHRTYSKRLALGQRATDLS